MHARLFKIQKCNTILLNALFFNKYILIFQNIFFQIFLNQMEINYFLKTLKKIFEWIKICLIYICCQIIYLIKIRHKFSHNFYWTAFYLKIMVWSFFKTLKGCKMMRERMRKPFLQNGATIAFCKNKICTNW